MKLDIGDGLMYAFFWFAASSVILGTIWMYHDNKSAHVYYSIPTEHKAEADKMWIVVYEKTAVSSSNDRASSYATNAINAAYGVPYIAKNNKLEVYEEYIPPALPIEKKSPKESF
jgi:hypothetical protein